MDITITEWEDGGVDEDPKSRLLAQISINGLSMNVEAIAVVEDPDGQFAADESFADMLDHFQIALGTAFQTAKIGERDYAIFATPYGSC